MKTKIFFSLFSLLFFWISNSQIKYSFTGLGSSSNGFKSITTVPAEPNILVSSSVTFASPIFYQTAISESAFTFTMKTDANSFTFYDMTWRNFGVARTLASGTKMVFKRGNLPDVTWTLSASALNGDTSAKTIFGESNPVTGVTQIIITADLTGFSNTTNNIEFKDITIAASPKVITTGVWAIDFTSATLGGQELSDNGTSITEWGVVYSPTAVNSNPIINGTGVGRNTIPAPALANGVFFENTAGLLPDTNYSFKMYAISPGGVGYGNILTFKTLDNVPPTFNGPGSTPTDNATSVPTTSNIILDFSENIKAGTGNITIKEISTSSIFEVFDITNATATSSPVNGAIGIINDKVYINPTNPFSERFTYVVQVVSSAITDISNNSFAGITDDITYNFNSADETSPALNKASFIPKDNTTKISTTANIVISFLENIVAGTGSITIRDVTNVQILKYLILQILQ